MKNKVMYISNRGPYSIGAVTHLKALETIYGAPYVVDFYNPQYEKKANYISYGKNRNPIEYAHRSIQKNIGCISNKIIKEICSIIKTRGIKLVFCEESAFGNLFKEIKKQNDQVDIICFYHDISADLFRQRRKQLPLREFHHKYILSAISIQQEMITQNVCDYNWVFNKADYKRFYKYYNKYPDAIVPMGGDTPIIPNDKKMVVTGEHETKKLFFVCSTGIVNIKGFFWFYENVLPYLRFDYLITIAGTGSVELGKLVNGKNINIVGKVDSLEEYYLDADIVIAPIFDGGGMKVKTLEALSYGKTLVGTPESLHGYWEILDNSFKQSSVFCCKQKEDWLYCLNSLGNKTISKFNQSLYDACKQSFSHDATVRYFLEELKKKELL